MDLAQLRRMRVPSTKEEIQACLEERREALRLVKAAEELLSQALDEFQGSVKEAMDLGLIKPAFPYKRYRRF